MSLRLDWLLIRHAETDWNREGRMQGYADVPLNAAGQAQAAQLAGGLRSVTLDAVYASDLSRATATAQALLHGRSGLCLTTTPQLRERHYGEFAAKTLAEVQALDPEGARQWSQRVPDYAPAGGETLLAFDARLQRYLNRLAEQHAALGKPQTIAIVTHGGVLDMVWRMVHGIAVDAPRQWPLPNTGVSRLVWQEGRWQILAWADTSHLSSLAVVRDETIA